jgi:hypothetical protein
MLNSLRLLRICKVSKMDRFHVYCVARSGDVDRLETDLARSPEIAMEKVGLTVLWNQANASGAYARAMETATAEVLIFAHCDVYFPDGWFARLAWEVDLLARVDPEWAVAGVSSLTASGEWVGRMYDSSLEPRFSETKGIFGNPVFSPTPIVSTDELTLIVRRAAAVSFDPLLPEFHLYGTDIILEAERRGKHSYGLDLPLIHNAKAQLRFGSDYVRAYKYMVRKWRARLPVPTTCGVLTASPFALPLRRLRLRYGAICRPSSYNTQRLSDPQAKAIEIGIEKLLAAPMVENRNGL